MDMISIEETKTWWIYLMKTSTIWHFTQNCEFVITLSMKTHGHYSIKPCKKVKESCNRPGVAHRVPGGLGSQISMTFGTWRWWGCQPHARAAFTPRKYSWYLFSLGVESTPGPQYGRKEYVTEKSSDTIRNRSQDRPTSSKNNNINNRVLEWRSG